MSSIDKIKKLLQFFENKRRELEIKFPQEVEYSYDIRMKYNTDYIQIGIEREKCLNNLKEEINANDYKCFDRIFDTHNMLKQGWRLDNFDNPNWFLHMCQSDSIDALNKCLDRLYNN